MEEEKLRIQWHPGFVAAINLELKANRKILTYEKEYNLNTKPLSIDLLVIKKSSKGTIENEIGQLFQKYNLMEYKSPEDRLDINTIYKANAYASLYKIYDGGKRRPEEITVSILRDTRPKGLFEYLKTQGGEVKNPMPRNILSLREGDSVRYPDHCDWGTEKRNPCMADCPLQPPRETGCAKTTAKYSGANWRPGQRVSGFRTGGKHQGKPAGPKRNQGG